MGKHMLRLGGNENVCVRLFILSPLLRQPDCKEEDEPLALLPSCCCRADAAEEEDEPPCSCTTTSTAFDTLY